MKTNLKDTTFIIPIRPDSVIRLENLLLTLDNIESYFETNITIIEASRYNSGLIQSLISDKVNYWFVEDKDPIFHRTKYLNLVSSQVKTAIVGIWDTDIILDPEQITKAVEQIRTGKYEVAYPYDGNFLDMSDVLRNYYCVNRKIQFLHNNRSKMKLLYSSPSRTNAVGGAFLISTERYVYSGLENEEFYGWGPEDGERYSRWKKLGYQIYRSFGPLFHLSHPRDINGGVDRRYIFSANKKKTIINLLNDSTNEELQDMIEHIKSIRGLPPLTK